MAGNGNGTDKDKLGWNATWSMAVGGMVGGGIFSVLGVVVDRAGSLAWLSFTIAGLIALCTGYSYARLAATYGEGGGAFTFLREIDRDGLAGSVSWVLIVGYVLTISVYAFTFGHYAGDAFGLGPFVIRMLGVGVVLVLLGVNLLGVGEAGGVEVVTVWGKLLVLFLLAGIGLWRWNPEMLSQGVQTESWSAPILGAASVFMAYEGFQLLSYDYEDIESPDRTLFQATMAAILAVIVVYVAVSLGAASLVGADTLVEQKEVALMAVGREALGWIGLVLVTIAAVFSTASAINATLFATARLAKDVAKDGELPEFVAHKNSRGVPDRAVIALAVAGAALAAVGSLSNLVEAASLIFLVTFGTVNYLAMRRLDKRRWIPAAGLAGAALSGAVLTWELITSAPFALATLAVLVLVAAFGRPYILRWSGVR